MEHWNALINKSHACNKIHKQLKSYYSMHAHAAVRSMFQTPAVLIACLAPFDWCPCNRNPANELFCDLIGPMQIPLEILEKSPLRAGDVIHPVLWISARLETMVLYAAMTVLSALAETTCFIRKKGI